MPSGLRGGRAVLLFSLGLSACAGEPKGPVTEARRDAALGPATPLYPFDFAFLPTSRPTCEPALRITLFIAASTTP